MNKEFLFSNTMKYVSVVGLGLFLYACQPNSQTTVSQPPIAQDTLTSIIAEVLLVEPALREAVHTLHDSLATHYYERILVNYGYELADFETSMRWLQEDPGRLEIAYEQVVEKLSVLETELRD